MNKNWNTIRQFSKRNRILKDIMTSISETGIGKVLGGKPIKYSDLAKELDVSERSYTRWVATLKKHGYINTLRTPYGLVLSVNKASKKFKHRDTPKVAYQSGRDTPKSYRDTPKSGERYANLAETKKTLHDYTKDSNLIPQKEEIQKISLSMLEYKKRKGWA